MNLEVSELSWDDWEKQVSVNAEACFFHTPGWLSTLLESYRFRPLFFSVSDPATNRFSLLPFMDVRSALTGKRGISLPFSDYCPPLGADNPDVERITEALAAVGRKMRWRSVEVRGGRAIGDIPAAGCYLGHRLSLDVDEEHLFKSFRESTRRNVRKAFNSRLSITISDSLGQLREFYRLHCLTRRRFGVPPQPWSFFRNLHHFVIERGDGVIVLARFGSAYIAGAIFCHHSRTALYKYGASDPRHWSTHANYLVMWEAIRWYRQRGFISLDFGRTDLGSEGLRQFKRGWGTEESEIRYYRYDLTRERFSDQKRPAGRLQRNILRKTPIPLLKLAGILLYRHFA